MVKRLSDRYSAIFDSYHNLTVVRDRFDWFWVLVGITVIVAGNVVAYLALHGVIHRLVVDHGRVLAGAALMAAMALLVYFGGGVLVGCMSKGYIVRELVVVVVVVLGIIFLLQLSVGMFNIVGLVVGAPFCFGVSYLGAVAGERWQDRRHR